MERREPGREGDVFCRHCTTHQPLDDSRVDVNQGRVWYRCATCDQWFLIRWEDAVELGIVEPVAP